ncbi:MAG: TIGR02186 family protein [Alphaproteobacteria bacterium]|jgi:uncharacterized protein (TIGR02186 family)
MKSFLYFLFIVFLINGANAREALLSQVLNEDINITASFDGAKIIVYGAIDPKLYNDSVIIITILGPRSKLKVSKKKKYFGVWLVSANNTKLLNAPGYYAMATNNTNFTIADSTLLKENQIGWENIQINTANGVSLKEDKEDYKNILKLFYKKRNLLVLEKSGIDMFEGTLFRADFELPGITPIGEYKVNTLLVNKEGTLLSSWHNNVKVTKGGIGAYLYDYSKEHSFLYGIFAALGAILLGFTASEIFRRI